MKSLTNKLVEGLKQRQEARDAADFEQAGGLGIHLDKLAETFEGGMLCTNLADELWKLIPAFRKVNHMNHMVGDSGGEPSDALVTELREYQIAILIRVFRLLPEIRQVFPDK